MSPHRTGLTLSLTVGVFYVACTLLWWIAPDRFMTFLNGLFHGLDFTLLRTQQGFDFATFLMVTAVWLVWAYALGACLAWVSNKLNPGQQEVGP